MGSAINFFGEPDNTKLLDTDSSHTLNLACGSNLSANRVLTFTPGDAARTVTLSGNPTLADWFDQAVKITSQPIFAAMFAKDASYPAVTLMNSTVSRASGVLLGQINFRDYDSQTYAAIYSHIDATGGNNDYPGRMTFWTTPDGSTTLTERMRITNAGYVGIGGTPEVQLAVVTAGDVTGISIGEASVTTGKMLMLGYDVTNNHGWIQTIYQNNSYTVLSINPSGGNVIVGNATDVNNQFTVGGNTITRSSAGTTSTMPLSTNRTVVSTENVTDYLIGGSFSPVKKISTGKTDSGYCMAGDFIGFRNLASDAGTVTGMYGIRCLSGNYGTPAGSSGASTSIYGMYLATYLGYGSSTTTYGIYIDKSHTQTPSTYYPLFVNSGTGDTSYFVGIVSAYTVTDRTKYPKSKEEAYTALSTMKAKDGLGELNHDVLHPFLKGPECKIYKKKTVLDHNGRSMQVDDVDQLPENQPTRDIGATLSCLVEVVNDIVNRVKEVEKK